MRQKVISVNNAEAIKLDPAKALVWAAQRVAVFNETFGTKLDDVRAQKGGKKVSAVRI